MDSDERRVAVHRRNFIVIEREEQSNYLNMNSDITIHSPRLRQLIKARDAWRRFAGIIVVHDLCSLIKPMTSEATQVRILKSLVVGFLDFFARVVQIFRKLKTIENRKILRESMIIPNPWEWFSIKSEKLSMALRFYTVLEIKKIAQ